ncbi:hypothetical protein M422DRAFT_786407 [Sphaerobolus stellatus SS14]|uniref:Uncharacterized protein n=1 Tax=Sphaerobolus stellatus (strain SS14) TaxID=990650 RepID=A0A0C9T1D8_SPHS4|nr:hypothetical protein M422DRAFT_786407 [Sphaerobolus stellatus SS14]
MDGMRHEEFGAFIAELLAGFILFLAFFLGFVSLLPSNLKGKGIRNGREEGLGKKEKESYNETKNQKKNITILGDEHRGIILLG